MKSEFLEIFKIPQIIKYFFLKKKKEEGRTYFGSMSQGFWSMVLVSVASGPGVKQNLIAVGA
jgi:hypothetical protein